MCYVFNYDDLASGKANGHGINNLYLCRYYLSHDNSCLNIINEKVWFVGDHPEHKFFDMCTNRILWKRISALQDAISRGLNRYSERQENWIKIKFDFVFFLWSYLLQYKTANVVEKVEIPSNGIIRCVTMK